MKRERINEKRKSRIYENSFFFFYQSESQGVKSIHFVIWHEHLEKNRWKTHFLNKFCYVDIFLRFCNEWLIQDNTLVFLLFRYLRHQGKCQIKIVYYFETVCFYMRLTYWNTTLSISIWRDFSCSNARKNKTKKNKTEKQMTRYFFQVMKQQFISFFSLVLHHSEHRERKREQRERKAKKEMNRSELWKRIRNRNKKKISEGKRREEQKKRRREVNWESEWETEK